MDCAEPGCGLNEQTTTQINAASTSASNAKASETNAATSKSAAATSADNAATSATAAANSAKAAADSARVNQADWNVTDTTNQAFIKNKPQNLKNIGDTDAINLYEFYKDDNAGNPVYVLIEELKYYSPNSNTMPAPKSYGFNGIVYGKLRNGNGYHQLMALVTVNLGYEYDFLYSSNNHYRPVVVKDEASNKYYWAMRTAGSYQNVIMLGQLTKKPLFTQILSTDRGGTLPSGWNLIYDAKTYELPNTIVGKAKCDRNGEQIDTTYLKKTDAKQSITTNTLTATDATFTGQTIVPTANEGNSSNAIASTEFVAKSIAALVNSAPETLNTLNELATALGNDPNFATTVTNALAKKMNEKEATDTFATKTEVSDLRSSTVAKTALWEALHSQDSTTLTGLTNAQWSALGVFIRYFTTLNNFENQPSQYGQLINLTADKNNEVAQLWLAQPDGILYCRGGNGNTAVKDKTFTRVANYNADGHLVFPNGAELWVD